MENFVYYCPTKIIFGHKKEEEVGKEISKYGKRVLLHYGGGSIKVSGLYDKVISNLKAAGLEVFELGGVQSNPLLSLVRKGIELCKKEHIEAIIAVGGGSVIDSAKGIAIGALYQGDVWDFYSFKVDPKESLPVGVILTIPAAGSEMSVSSVITNEENQIKFSFRHEILRPKFSILDPELISTVPMYHIAAGICDMFCHVAERYFTNSTNVNLTNYLCEGTMKNIIEVGPKYLANPSDYDAAAEVMWSSTMAHNGILETGRISDWASHRIEHELSALYDISHGAGLAIIMPAWMRYVYHHDINLFAHYASSVFNVKVLDDKVKMAEEGIQKTTEFFASLGLPTSLMKANIRTDQFELIANKCTKDGPVGKFLPIDKKAVLDILEIAK